jgi:hypothetical protein
MVKRKTSMSEIGLRNINGVNVVPLDGLWETLGSVETGEKLQRALEYSGCEFSDDDHSLVSEPVVALAGIGGIPVCKKEESDQVVGKRINDFVAGTRETMANSAAFSYLNAGEKSLPDLYETAIGLGHFSITHTVQANFLIAGISEGAELEINLQRDLVHLSKVTNARTKIQNKPPLVLSQPQHAKDFLELRNQTVRLADKLREDSSGDTLEFANSIFPVCKATLFMLSGDLSNLRKFTQLEDDEGKERELRDIAGRLKGQLILLWPEIMKKGVNNGTI